MQSLDVCCNSIDNLNSNIPPFEYEDVAAAI